MIIIINIISIIIAIAINFITIINLITITIIPQSKIKKGFKQKNTIARFEFPYIFFFILEAHIFPLFKIAKDFQYFLLIFSLNRL